MSPSGAPERAGARERENSHARIRHETPMRAKVFPAKICVPGCNHFPVRCVKWRMIQKLIPIIAALTVSMASAADSSIYDLPLKDINGKDAPLGAFKGKVMLIVNVASYCGNTPQYTALEELHNKFKGEGLAVIGFPCNDFGAQEPGTPEEIKTFCSTKYKVTFPLYEKVVVKGDGKCELYQLLSGPKSPFPGDVKWNFGKFLVGRDGKVVKRFEPKVKPDAPEVLDAIKAALAAK